jgi:hypothetical protein
MITILLKAAALWLVLLGVAIGNAAIRELMLNPTLGAEIALPASGLLLALLILVFALVTLPLFGARDAAGYLLVGAVWLVLTLSFELVLGHLVMGKSWGEIARVLDPRTGNLFLLALVSALISPWLAARLRGRI